MIAKGLNESDSEETISSDENAPLKRVISTEEKDNIMYMQNAGNRYIEEIRRKDLTHRGEK